MPNDSGIRVRYTPDNSFPLYLSFIAPNVKFPEQKTITREQVSHTNPPSERAKACFGYLSKAQLPVLSVDILPSGR